jgi:hypothetical protein
MFLLDRMSTTALCGFGWVGGWGGYARSQRRPALAPIFPLPHRHHGAHLGRAWSLPTAAAGEDSPSPMCALAPCGHGALLITAVMRYLAGDCSVVDGKPTIIYDGAWIPGGGLGLGGGGAPP